MDVFGILGRNFFQGGGGGGGEGKECKTQENSIFLRKGKTVISMGKSEIFLDLR